ncbi:MAG: ATP-dependent RNA helicase [endosymbiont of Galathealinum brachiosum]|uniref:ATP-dependent RNA helicase RhlE n=1 Tax=endosymbiont of Galathealinum brachiosum TaxID=2200906 RepID=A0A370D6U2_9GAMM|nr:MAG: ATP-dependent RNA helicase [endosymbiont of Galathealinum brachiosum]
MNSEVKFQSLGLSPEILKAIEEKGYKTPSPIQRKAIPVVLQGKDLMAAAQTGTGKTAGFTLPVLHQLTKGQRASANQARVLILTPTRELAAQIGESVLTYGKYLPLRSTVVYGGVKINPQMMTLRKGVDILVATPGRLLDLYNQNAIKFKQLEILVLDEADRMLDMGFIHDIRKILAILPKQRQNLMFSATFSDEIRKLAKGLVNKPVEISVTPRNTTAKTVKQWICPVDKKKKPDLLTSLIKQYDWQQVLVFCRTKQGANKLSNYLNQKDIKSAAIHGNKSQGARTKALNEFKQGKVDILVATDIAARGLDIDHLPQVVNFDLPNVAEDYIHRIGRTGRAGLEGQAVSLVSADEFDQLSDIEHLIKKLLTRKLIDGFEPRHDVPESKLWKKDKKPKRPKKPKTGHKDGQRSAENAQGHKSPGQSPKPSTGKKINKNRNRRSGAGKASGSNDGSRPPKRKFKPKSRTPR